MSVIQKRISRQTTRAGQRANQYPADSRKFDRTVTWLSLWLVVGLYADGAAHHNIPDLIDSFFTPWHGILYSAFFALDGFLVFHLATNIGQGYRWTHALPYGYHLAFLGVPIFLAGGIGDMVWHTLFGFEEGIETLISPTHLLLASGGALLITGPLRVAWSRSKDVQIESWANLFPALVSLFALLSLLTFFTEYANALALPNFIVERVSMDETVSFFVLVQSIAGVLLPAAILMGIVLLAILRWRLPFGSMTLLIFGNSLLMAVFHIKEVSQYPQVLLVALAAGLFADVLYARLKPSPKNRRAVRWFAFLVPFALFGGFFVTLILTAGTWWSVHLWPGVTFLAGIVGLLVSYIALPPVQGQYLRGEL